MNLINLFVMSILTENIVLMKFLGICPFVGTSSKEKSAIGMGAAVTIVITLSSIITYLLYYYVLVPTDTAYLKTLAFVLVVACMVQMMEMLIQKINPKLYQSLGIYLPLITTNCAVLGVLLLNITNQYSFMETITFSVGSSLGFTLVIYVFSTIREALEKRNVPVCFKGYPIALVTASIMALLFSRYMIV